MKINCNWFSDWRRSVRAKKLRNQRVWHKKFVFYKKLGERDCRILEMVERKMVLKKHSYPDSFWNDHGDTFYYLAFEYQYRYRSIK